VTSQAQLLLTVEHIAYDPTGAQSTIAARRVLDKFFPNLPELAVGPPHVAAPDAATMTPGEVVVSTSDILNGRFAVAIVEPDMPTGTVKLTIYGDWTDTHPPASAIAGSIQRLALRMQTEFPDAERLAGDLELERDLRWRWHRARDRWLRRAYCAQARVRDLERALRAVIDEACSMDQQIDGEWGIGGGIGYVERDEIAAARAVLDAPPAVDETSADVPSLESDESREPLDRLAALQAMLTRIRAHGASGLWSGEDCAIGAIAVLEGEQAARDFMAERDQQTS
jgi:hypothetical protein